jgi:hypothetical protein
MPMRSRRDPAQGLGHLVLVHVGDGRDGGKRLLGVGHLELHQQAAQVALVTRQRAIQQQCAFRCVELQQAAQRVDVLLDERGLLLQAAVQPFRRGAQHRHQVLGCVLDVFVDVEEEGAFFVGTSPGAVAP